MNTTKNCKEVIIKNNTIVLQCDDCEITLEDDVAENVVETYETLKYRRRVIEETYETLKYRRRVIEYIKRHDKKYKPEILDDEDLLTSVTAEYLFLDRENGPHGFVSDDKMIEYAIDFYDDEYKYRNY